MLMTFVRHSAWDSPRKDPQFKYAVQEHYVHGKKEEEKIRKAGGLLVDASLQDAETTINYPPDKAERMGLIPRCEGTFGRMKLAGLHIYLPTEKDKRALEKLKGGA